MRIRGFQKFSLLDYPDRICAILFTGGCNFRCPFCHNPSLAFDADPGVSTISSDEILAFLSTRIGRLDGVCVTGGEPLLQPDLPDLLREIKRLGFLVKLDTNGSFPDRLEGVLRENLVDYVAMDIKNAPEKYGETVGLSSFSTKPVEKSAFLLRDGIIDYEFRTTVVREFHTIKEIDAIGRWLAGGKRFILQSFRNSEPIISSRSLHAVSPSELQEIKSAAFPYFETVEIRD